MRAGALGGRRRYLKRAEPAREGDLRFIGDILIAKDQDRMLFEGGAHRLIRGVIVGDIGKRYAAQFGGKTRPQRDDIHRAPHRLRLLNFPSKARERQAAHPQRRSGTSEITL